MPAYQSEDAAGMDLVAALQANADVVLAPESGLIPTGFAIELPKGYEAQISARSGLALNDGVAVLNSPGTIDADYRGEIGVILVNFGSHPSRSSGERGSRNSSSVRSRGSLFERAAPSSARGAGGFGSTGRA